MKQQEESMDKQQPMKYNTNEPETEEQHGLQSAKLRLSKVLQRRTGQQDPTSNSFQLLKNMQMKMVFTLKDKESLNEDKIDNSKISRKKNDNLNQALQIKRSQYYLNLFKMKKTNFELIFKIIVLIQLTIILFMLLFPSNDNTEMYESNKNGRYKEVKTKNYSYGKETDETVRILDTQTGEFVEP